MSWFGSSKYALFEENIEKATSESIPNGDIDFATALELSDLIRSKQVPPKEAMRILKKRFTNADNLNMQKSAFKLIDFCIKNGGSHFIAEIATKEFMDPLVVMLRNHSINESLKSYILENIQMWSIMVSTNQQFDYINKTYTKLQDEGFEFPAINDIIDPNLIESKVAPEWQDSDACMMCSKMFTFINRKHHCRSCGGVFCSAHSDRTIELPELGINIPVRVCDNCYTDQKSKRKKSKHSRSASTNKKAILTDDDEIKRAIELSLKESSGSTVSDFGTFKTLQPTHFDEEDQAMKAAIEASLQDLGMSNEKPIDHIKEPPVEESTGLYANLLPKEETYVDKPAATFYENPSQKSAYNVYSSPQLRSVSAEGITPNEEISIVQFVNLVDRMKYNPAIRNQVFPELLRLQADMVILNPKINKMLEKELIELEKFQVQYSKLFTINKLYNDVIQTKLRQDQEQAKIQSYQTGIQHQQNLSVLSNVHNLDPATETYSSSQSAYRHSPQVIQQLNAGSLTMNPPVPLNYAHIPTEYTQNLSEPKPQLTFDYPTSPLTDVNNLKRRDDTYPELNPPAVQLNGLDSLQYAPVPEHIDLQVSSKQNLKNNQNSISQTHKEPEVVNLIDL